MGGGGQVRAEVAVVRLKFEDDAERESWDIRNDESHSWDMYVR